MSYWFPVNYQIWKEKKIFTKFLSIKLRNDEKGLGKEIKSTASIMSDLERYFAKVHKLHVYLILSPKLYFLLIQSFDITFYSNRNAELKFYINI